MKTPISEEWLRKMQSYGICTLDAETVKQLREHIKVQSDDVLELDQDPEWVARRRLFFDGYEDAFYCLLELVESPIEQLFGAYLLLISDGYNEVYHDFMPGRHPDPEWGTFFRCQQELYGYRVDFMFKVNLNSDYRVLIVECDGHDYHERTKEQAARDRKRDRGLIDTGAAVIRFTGSEIYNDPVKCAEEVEQHLYRLARDLLIEHGIDPGARKRPLIPR